MLRRSNSNRLGTVPYLRLRVTLRIIDAAGGFGRVARDGGGGCLRRCWWPVVGNVVTLLIFVSELSPRQNTAF